MLGRSQRTALPRLGKLRAGFEQTSEDLGVIPAGQVIDVEEKRVNELGITRVRCSEGWLSVSARDGTRLLRPLRDDDSDADSFVTETEEEDDGEEVLTWLEGLKLEQFYDEFEEWEQGGRGD